MQNGINKDGGKGVPTALSVGWGGWNLTWGMGERVDSHHWRQHEGMAGVVGWQVQSLSASREVDAAGLCLSAWSGDSHFSFIALYRAGRRCCCSSWLAQLYHPSHNLVKKGCRKYEIRVEPSHGKHLL